MQRQANFWKLIDAETNLTIPNAGKETIYANTLEKSYLRRMIAYKQRPSMEDV